MQANDEGRLETQSPAENENGETWGDENQVRIHADGDGISEDRRYSSEDADQPVRSAGTHDQTNDAEQREINIRLILGKILSRVNDLERKHLEYVEAHERRLEQRLQESKVSKDEALQLIDEIRELTRLIEQSIDEEDK